MEIDSLVELGFTKNQARLYLFLLKNPGVSAGQISKDLAIDRSFTYNIIESLIKKGIVYSEPKNKKLFYPEEPKKILDNLKEQLDKANVVVSNLESMKPEIKNSSNIGVYEGKPALRKYILEIINAKSFLTLGGGGNLNLFNILKYEHPHYFNQIKKNKVSGKIICAENNKQFWSKNLKDSTIEIKSLGRAGRENSITILNDRIILSSESESPKIIIINDPDHAHSLKHYFEYLWKIAKS